MKNENAFSVVDDGEPPKLNKLVVKAPPIDDTKRPYCVTQFDVFHSFDCWGGLPDPICFLCKQFDSNNKEKEY